MDGRDILADAILSAAHTFDYFVMCKMHVIVSLAYLIMKTLLYPWDHKSCCAANNSIEKCL